MRRAWPVVFAFAVASIALASTTVPVVAQSVDETKLADSNTRFRRIVIQGDADDTDQEADWTNDREELEAEFRRHQRADSVTYKAPSGTWTETSLRQILASLKDIPSSEEITIYFRGHGSWEDGGRIRLNNTHPDPDERRVTAAELADILDDFTNDPTILVVLSTCWGGSFIGEIEVGNRRKVIGAKTLCYGNWSWSIFDWLYTTFTESLRDALEDVPTGGTLSGSEAKDSLIEDDFDLGDPGASPGRPKKGGKSECDGCDQPELSMEERVVPAGGELSLAGVEHEANTTVTARLAGRDPGHLVSLVGASTTDANGEFLLTVEVPEDTPPGTYVVESTAGEYTAAHDQLITVTDATAVPAAGVFGILALGVVILTSATLGSHLRRRAG